MSRLGRGHSKGRGLHVKVESRERQHLTLQFIQHGSTQQKAQ